MKKLTFNELPLGGFAGLTEKQFIKDNRVFSSNRQGKAFDGLGNLVYLADANFLPNRETDLHPHKEIDVISVMVDGVINHAGSLEHGKSIIAGQAQAQRAGGEGFEHNEITPSDTMNQMIQLWVLPETSGTSADYKVYTPKKNQLTTIYGGNKNQNKTFDSHTHIQVANTDENFEISIKGQVLAYLSKGSGEVNGRIIGARTLIRVEDELAFQAQETSQLIVITEK